MKFFQRVIQKLQGYLFGDDERMMKIFAHRKHSNFASFIRPHINENTHILDVGCGPGSVTADFAGICSKGRVVGVDDCPAAISLAQKMYPSSSANFLVASAYTLPFGDGEFDVACANSLLQHLSDPESAVRECKRVLKPGGIFAAREAVDELTTVEPHISGMRKYLDMIYKAIDKMGGDINTGRRLPSICRAAGFKDMKLSSDSEVNSPWITRFLNESHAILQGSVLLENWKKLGLVSDADVNEMRAGVDEMLTLQRESMDKAYLLFIHKEIIATKDA